jgi:hypothetical protein
MPAPPFVRPAQRPGRTASSDVRLRPVRSSVLAVAAILALGPGPGCTPPVTGPTLAAPPPGPAVRPIAPASPGATVAVTVTASEATRAVLAPAATLVIDLLPIDAVSPWGLPLRTATPLVRAVRPGFAGEASVDFVLPADPGGARLVAWIDLDRSGRLDVGDHVSDPAAPDNPSLVVRRIWVTRLGTLPPRPRRLTVSLPVGQPPTHGRILLLGWEELGPSGAIPRTPPALSWRSESRRREWPETLELTVAGLTDLYVLAVLDRDGDDRPGPGDLLAPPVPPGAWSPDLSLVFSQPFGAGPSR